MPGCGLGGGVVTACRRCDWRPDLDGSVREQLAGHAAESGHLLCVVCGWSLAGASPQTCPDCVASVRRELGQIVDLFALLEPMMLGLAYGQPAAARTGGRGAEEQLLGGDALVMLAGGSSSGHDRDGLENDPPAVAAELGLWEDDWRSVRGEPAASGLATVAGATDYLGRRLSWAADHHPAFDEFASDVRRLRSRLRSATATDDRPETGAPCFECGAKLERRRANRVRRFGCRGHGGRCPWPHEPHGCADVGGLVDEWQCPRCRRRYEDAEYWLAVRANWQMEAG